MDYSQPTYSRTVLLVEGYEEVQVSHGSLSRVSLGFAGRITTLEPLRMTLALQREWS